MYAGQAPKKFIWLAGRAEAAGIVCRASDPKTGDPWPLGTPWPDGTEIGIRDDFDLQLDEGYRHLASLLPANNPLWSYRREEAAGWAMLHLETYVPDPAVVNHPQDWWGPPSKGAEPFTVRNPATGEVRPLRAGDRVRVFGRWVLDHHPEYYFPVTESGLSGIEFIGINLALIPVPLRVGFAHVEFHPFDWRDIQLVADPPPGGRRTALVAAAAPIHEQLFLGDGKWLANESAGVAGRSAIENDQRNWHETMEFDVAVAVPPLPAGFRGAADLVDWSRNDVQAPPNTTRLRVVARDDGIVASVRVAAPKASIAAPVAPGALGGPMPIASIDAPSQGPGALQVELSVGWKPRLAFPDAAEGGQGIQLPPAIVGASAPFAVRVSNRGPDFLEISSVEVGGADAAAFAMAPVQTQVGPGQIVQLAGQFTPGADRVHHAEVTVASNDPAHPRVSVGISGATAGAPPSGELEVAAVPPARVGRMQLTVSAVDRVTRAPVAGRVMITNPLSREVDVGPTNQPFTFTFTSRRVGPPGNVEIRLPTARVTGLPAPYRDTPVALFEG